MAIVNPLFNVAAVHSIAVAATGGTFTITPAGAYTPTAAIAFNAPAADVQAALNAVTTLDGDVTVAGGPGDLTGSTPYVLTWRAGLGAHPAPVTDPAGLTGGASTATVTVTAAGTTGWEPVTLSAGEHDDPTGGTGSPAAYAWNMMEAAAWMADDPWSSEPANVSPVIAAVCNSFNDLLPHVERQDLQALLDVAPVGVIDTVDGAKETAREWMCSDWLVRTLLPMYLDYSTDTDVLAASTAIKALAPLAAGWTGEAATLAALEDAGRAVWAWRATLEPDSFEVTGGGGPAFAAVSLVTLFDSLGGDYIDHWFGLVRGVDGVTSTGSDDGGQAMTTAIRAMRQAVWDTCLTWVPNEFFTGRSVDYAFRRGGDYVPGSAFMLIRECVQALVAGQALSDVALLAYTDPESGFSDYYTAAIDAAEAALVALGVGTDAQASMVDLIADLAAY